ncbi:DJ-1/PfpI family protein [Colletotrichum eremochloae]|nr:DJ-1/PfpI family protein [Colletotrichum eremochloae]
MGTLSLHSLPTLLNTKLSFFVTLVGLSTITSAVDAPSTDAARPPKNWAVAIYDSFDTIDVFGPLNPLWYLAFSLQMNLALIAPTLSPVWVQPADPALNKQNSSFWFSDIEVLLIPGGPGSVLGNVDEVIDFVKDTYPSLKYLITTCTGAGIAARAGVLDEKRATTNKKAWTTITAMGPKVEWVSPARWTVDGNVWTSSGVTSGLDLIFAFIEEVYGKDYAKGLQDTIEYVRAENACDDPFAAVNDVPPSGICSMT